MRNLVASNGGGYNTAMGKGAMYMGGGSHNTAMGFWALGGTAGIINVAGSATTGDIIHVTFTGQFTGSPHTVSYTVPASSTPASIATGLAAAFLADATIAPKLTSNTCIVVDNTNVQPWFCGTALTGTANGSDGISMTTSVTGAGTEILTVSSNGSDGTFNVVLGASAVPGYYITTASYNFAAMDDSLHYLTSGSYNIVIGSHAGYKVSSGSNNILFGNNNGMALTLGSNNTIIGVNQASNVLSTGSGNLYLAAGAASSTIDAATAGESNTFRLGNNTVNVMRATGINTATPKFFLDWFPTSTTYANDAAAATGGVAVGQIYRNGSVMMCRVA
jgi:hypothetical protein